METIPFVTGTTDTRVRLTSARIPKDNPKIKKASSDHGKSLPTIYIKSVVDVIKEKKTICKDTQQKRLLFQLEAARWNARSLNIEEEMVNYDIDLQSGIGELQEKLQESENKKNRSQ